MRFLTTGTANPEERADSGHKSDTEVGLRLRGGGDVSSGEEFEFTKRMPVRKEDTKKVAIRKKCPDKAVFSVGEVKLDTKATPKDMSCPVEEVAPFSGFTARAIRGPCHWCNLGWPCHWCAM